MRQEVVERAFIISRIITRYPVLADQVRRTMRRLLADSSGITNDFLMEEAHRKAIEDQQIEGVVEPLEAETGQRWEARVIEHYRQLTDYYFALHHKVDDVVAIMDEIKVQHMDLHQVVESGEVEATLFHKVQQAGDTDEATGELLKVNLIRTIFSDQLDFIGIAKRFFTLSDLQEIKARIIGTGKVGGKAAGLLLAASMIRKAAEQNPDVPEIRTPACYFIGSDVFYNFFEENRCKFYKSQKYKPVEQVRAEYNKIRETIRNYALPWSVVIKLRNLLNKFQGKPLIVRSSSLLEDNVSTSFAGKYESVFVANNGTTDENLEELLDAIRFVYASVFSPDVIAYRKEKKLLDYDERMGILIQNVVGKRRGDVFAPFLAGVGFSLNMFRWSQRIREEEGMLRLVMGLGTRAVGRVGNDYPRMVPLSEPTLRPEKNPKDIMRYSQKQIDVLDLNSSELTEVSVQRCDKAFHHAEVGMAMSLHRDGYILDSWFDRSPGDRLVATMNEVLRSNFPVHYRQILRILKESWGMQVDTEFAIDFDTEKRHMDIYLLQCRPLSMNKGMAPVEFPEVKSEEQVLFKATGITPCGLADNIRYLVMVHPDAYYSMEMEQRRHEVGQVVGRLNRLLPPKSFILFGPGRWGTVDVKLGVHVGYGDISNASVLVELADGSQGYTSEVSYGTHFYLDLVEAQIYPLSIMLEQKDTCFNMDWIRKQANILDDLLPDESEMAPIIQVIDLEQVEKGRRLSVYMSLRKGRSLAVFEKP